MPAFDAAVDADWYIALFANNAAEASGFVAGGNVSESICQVIELAAVEELLGHVVL